MNVISSPDTDSYQGRLHLILFFWPMFTFMAGCYVRHQWGDFFGLPLMVLGVGWVFYALLLYLSSSICITTHYITIQTGILFRQTLNISLQQLESLDAKQSLVGSLLDYGRLVIRGTGGTFASFSPVAHLLTCRRFIEMRGE